VSWLAGLGLLEFFLGEFLFFPWFPWVSVAVSVRGICFRVPWFPWPAEQADAKQAATSSHKQQHK
jgi:hypothetical protein